MKFEFDPNAPVYQNFRKNEVFRPAPVGWYFILLTFIMISGLSMIISPASAYSAISTNTVTGTATGYGGIPASIYVNNSSAFNAYAPITLITYETHAGEFTYISSSGNKSIKISPPGSACKGNGTAEWTYSYGDDLTPYDDNALISYRITDLHDICGDYSTKTPAGFIIVDSDGSGLAYGDVGLSNFLVKRDTTVGLVNGFGPIDGWRQHSANNVFDGTVIFYSGIFGDEGPPVIDFAGIPTSGTAPLTVNFTITNYTYLNTSAENTWHWGDGKTSPVSTALASHTYTATGNYTVVLSYTGIEGTQGTITKTDYIWVYNSTSLITTPWRAEDMVFGGLVANAEIDLLDIENDSWVNVTSPTGKSSITSLSTHKLSGYGFAPGFEDAEQLVVAPQAFPGYVLYMYPSGFTNVSEGNVTVFVKAEDIDTGLAVVGATVTGQAAGSGSQVKTTNSAGWAQFVFPNNTDVHFKGEKTGYTGSTTIVLNTGIPSGGDAFVTGTVYLTKGSITVLPTTTVTTLPGGGTPTPVQTYLPHCDPAASDYSAEECRAEQSSFSLSWLADNMLLLIQICFIFTILYIAGWKP